MTREEAKSFLIDISYKLGNMSVEYLTEKDGEKMREAIEALEQEPLEVEATELQKAYHKGFEDCRKAVLDIVDSYSESQSNVEDVTQDIISYVVALPPVNPQPYEDAISRQAVLDMMQMRMSGKELYKAVYELPPVTPKQSRWIPVSKRLPESGKEVLVWYEYWSDKRESMVQTFGISFYWNTWCGDVMGIKARCIAWMPLPEPYKENEK